MWRIRSNTLAYLLVTVVLVLVLYGVERLFHLARRGRTLLALILVTWGLVDAVLSVRENPGNAMVAFIVFTSSLFSSVAPVVLWLCVSAWIRKSSACRLTKEIGSEPPKNAAPGSHSDAETAEAKAFHILTGRTLAKFEAEKRHGEERRNE